MLYSLAATAGRDARNQVYNIAVGDRTSLNELYETLRDTLSFMGVDFGQSPHYGGFRNGDVMHSQADISKARELLGYTPTHNINDGLKVATEWYVSRLGV